MIELRNISQRFVGADGPVNALDDVSISVQAGEIFGIIGRSGAGKSTLVRVINLLNRPTSGTVQVAGRDLTALSADELRAARREIGMIFQHFNLLSSRTVYDNIALPLELAGVSKADIKKRVMDLLDLVGLSSQKDRYPAQISGGQKQRVGIARALASNPKVLLSDEATSALDPETTRSILDLLKRINKELGLTVVLITHQMEVIKQICDRVTVLEAGKVVEEGRVLDVFLRPQHSVTRAMIGDIIAQDLPDGVRERIREKMKVGQHRLFRFAFSDTSVDQPLLSEAIRRYELDFNILHGQIDELQGHAFGSLAVLVGGDPEKVQAAVTYLGERDVVVEEISYEG